MDPFSLAHVPDGDLVRNLSILARLDCKTTAVMLAHLAEVAERKLYVPAGYSSMFEYCVRVLGFSEDMTWKRTQVAKAGRQYPGLLAAIAEGRLHLSGACLLVPRLAAENVDELLAASERKTKAQIEKLLAERFPREDVRTSIRALPAPAVAVAPDRSSSPAPGQATPISTGDPPASKPAPGHLMMPSDPNGESFALEPSAEQVHAVAAPPRPTRITPLAPGRFAVQTTLGERAHGKLRQLQKLLSHQVRRGDVAAVLERAFDALIEKLEKQRFGGGTRASRKRGKATAGSRYVPKSVRRAVWERDGGRCTFVSDAGVRCAAETRLELDHVLEVARGGESTVDNLRLRCRAHNQYSAECTFGSSFMAAKRRRAAGPGDRA